jgi:hypothetical protein
MLTKATQAPTDPTHPSGHDFGYWSRSSTPTATSRWYFNDELAPTKLISNTTLYAIFISEVPISFDIFWDSEDVPSLTTSSAVWTQAAYYNGIEQTATISFTNLDGYVIDEWSYEGNPTVHTPPDAFTPITSIVLNNLSGDIAYVAKGTHTFHVSISKSGFAPQSISFTLTVN